MEAINQIQIGANNSIGVWIQLTGLALIVLGWLIVNSQHNSRERRKEIRAQIDQCESALAKLESIAITYHTAAAHDVRMAQEIRCQIERLVGKISRMQILESAEYSRIARGIRKAITYQNFDSTRHVALGANDPIIEEIGAVINDAQHSLEMSFIKTYS